MRQRALVVGVGAFKSNEPVGLEEPATGVGDGWDPLPFAEKRASEVGDALAALGVNLYRGDIVTNPALDELKEALEQALAEAGASGALVVHILSHGLVSKTRALYVMSATSRSEKDSLEVDQWLRKVEDVDGHPGVLLLLDVCRAGAALEAQWRQQLSADRRKTWVLAATEADEDAYQGRFSQAVTGVLRSLRSGGLDIHPSQEWVPISLLAKRIQLELDERCRHDNALPQQVIADRVDPVREPTPRFFRNPLYEPDAAARYQTIREQSLRDLLAELDGVFDPAHYLSRALGRMDQTDVSAACCFSGRKRQLKALAGWLDGDATPRPGLRVVMGSPGAGKSALLGVLVCAAHPQLQEAARSVRDRVGEDCLPSRNSHLAAVHARGRRLDEVVESVARQLDLNPSGGGWTAAGLVETLSRDPFTPTPVIVVDALDEADNPKDVQDLLLLPLARAATSSAGDRMACRLLVGTRPWSEFASLLQAARDDGELIDLDTVEATQLAQDLTAYVQRLLATSRLYDAAGMRSLRKDIAEAVARVLVANSVEGPFLVAALYTHHLLSLDAPVEDPVRIRDEVPRTPGAMLELHLRHLHADPWLRPVLAAIAHAKDHGMPSRLLRAVAGVFRVRPAEGDMEPSVNHLAVVLDSIRFYLRRSVDADGTILYRLFHQGLADYLRQHSLSAQESVT